jgi:hypothetical protein
MTLETSLVLIEGNPIKNQLLNAIVTNVGGTTGSINYQWESSLDGIVWTNLAGATSSMLLLTASLVGYRVRFIVSATNDQGNSESLTSLATEPITDANIPGSVAILCNATSDQVLTAVLTDPDGINGDVLYQWQSTSNGISWSDIVGATSSSFFPTNLLVGKQLRVTVSYTDNQGNSESLTSSATASITGAKPVITLPMFRAEYFEFGEIPDELVEVNLAKALRIVNEVTWRNYYQDAVLLLTAHELFLRQQEAILTQVQAAAIREQATFQTLNLARDSNYYSLSNYGLRLLALKKQLPRCGFTW